MKKMFLILAVVMLGSVIFYGMNKKESSSLTTMSNEQLQTFIDNKETGLVYIGRPTCPHCQKFQPIYEEVLQQKRLTSYYYNTDDAREADEEHKLKLLDFFSVDSVPTVLYIEDGLERDRLQGEVTKNELKEWLRENRIIGE